MGRVAFTIIQSWIETISLFWFLCYHFFVIIHPGMVYNFGQGSVLQVKKLLKTESQKLCIMTFPEDEQYICHQGWKVHQCLQNH